MLHRHPWVPIAVLLVGIAGSAHGETKKEDPKTAKAEARFADGSSLQLLVLQDSIDVQTKYGKLTVSLSEIRRIEFGFRVPEEVAKKIDAAIRKLGDNSFKEREAALNDLLSMAAQAYPALQAAADNPDAEVSRRAKEALAQIRDKVPADQLNRSTHDRIETRDFPIVGRIMASTLKARTSYFGEVAVNVHDLRSLCWVGTAGDLQVSVDATKYANPGQWMETEIVVESGVGLTITSSGKVDLWPQGPGQYMCTPKGYAADRAVALAPSSVTAQGGTLVGRIGQDGTPFVIGESYQATPSQQGKLYLHIAPSPWNNASTGGYVVKVTAGGK